MACMLEGISTSVSDVEDTVIAKDLLRQEKCAPVSFLLKCVWCIVNLVLKKRRR